MSDRLSLTRALEESGMQKPRFGGFFYCARYGPSTPPTA